MNNLDKYFNSYKNGVKNVPFDKKEVEMKFFSKRKSKNYIPILIGFIGLVSSVVYLFQNKTETKMKTSNYAIIENDVFENGTDENIIDEDLLENKLSLNNPHLQVQQTTDEMQIDENKSETIKEKERFITFRDENNLLKSPIKKNFNVESKEFGFSTQKIIDKYSDPDELILNKSSNSSIAGIIIPVIDEVEAEKMQFMFENETINFKFLTKEILAKNSFYFNEKYKNDSKTMALYNNNYPLSLDSFEILQDVFIELDLLDKLKHGRQLPDSLEFVDYTDDYKQIRLINRENLQNIKNEIPIPYLVAFKMEKFNYEHQIFNRNFSGIEYRVDGIDKDLQLIPIVIKINSSKVLNSIVAWYPITRQLANSLPDRYKKILEYELEVLEKNSKELCEKIPEQNFLGVCSNNLNNIGIEKIFVNSNNSELNLNLTVNSDLRINLKVYDMMGKEVGTYFNEQISSRSFNKRLNLNGLSKGIYILELTSDKGDYLTKRFITN
jgi:hypothetical protein